MFDVSTFATSKQFLGQAVIVKYENGKPESNNKKLTEECNKGKTRSFEET